MKRIIYAIGLTAALCAGPAFAQELSKKGGPDLSAPADKRFSDADRIFGTADLDNSKSLTLDEFIDRDLQVRLENGDKQIAPSKQARRAERAFDLIDKNGDGLITRREFRRSAPKSMKRPKLEREVVQMPLGTEAEL